MSQIPSMVGGPHCILHAAEGTKSVCMFSWRLGLKWMRLLILGGHQHTVPVRQARYSWLWNTDYNLTIVHYDTSIQYCSEDPPFHYKAVAVHVRGKLGDLFSMHSFNGNIAWHPRKIIHVRRNLMYIRQ